jgi:hypothetical protein
MQEMFKYKALLDSEKAILLTKWKDSLSEEKFANLENSLGVYNWYEVNSVADNDCYAIFQVINVFPKNRNKNMELNYSPLKFKENVTFKDEKFQLGLNVLKCAFDALLEITTKDSFKNCKIHSHDEFILTVYSAFAQSLDVDDYSVSFHGRGKWIEIEKK